MDYIKNEFYLMISGKRACFTNPMLKMERMSYDFITPGAAECIFASVYSHPNVKWVIEEIRVINPITYYCHTTNEVKNFNVPKNINSIKTVNVTESRILRNTTFLTDVCYIVKGHIEEETRLNSDEEFNLKKCIEIFLRRMEREQYYYQPYLGIREFPATLQLIDEKDLNKYIPINKDCNYGLMLHHVDLFNGDRYMFNAVMHKGIIDTQAEGVIKL